MRGAWKTTHRARCQHTCTCCFGPIGRGDDYEREAVAPWALGDWSEGRWEVIKRCFTCIGGAAPA